MATRNGAGVTIPVNLQVQMGEMAGQLEKVKKAFASVKPEAKGYKQLEGYLKSIEREFESIKRNAGETFTTHGQIDTFARRFERLKITTENFSDGFKKLDFSAFDETALDQELIQQITNAKTQINSLQESLTSLAENSFRDLVLNSQEISEVLTRLKINPEDFIEGKGFDAINNSTEELTESIKELRKEQEKKEKDKDTESNKLNKQKETVNELENSYLELALAADAAAKARDKADRVTRTLKKQKTPELEALNKAKRDLDVDKKNFGTKTGRATYGATYFDGKGNFKEGGKEALAKYLISSYNLTQKDLEDAGLEKITEASLSTLYTVLLEKINTKIKKINEEVKKAETDLQQKNSQAEAAQTKAASKEQELKQAEAEVSRIQAIVNNLEAEIKVLSQKAAEARAQVDQNNLALEKTEEFGRRVEETIASSDENARIRELTLRIQVLENQLKQTIPATQQASEGIEIIGNNAGQASNQIRNQLTNSLDEANESMRRLEEIQNSIKQWFGFNEVINLTKNTIRDAISHIRELDDVMTEIAVVTDMTQQELWAQISTYSEMAQKYGATTQGVYEVSQLYYQQGLQTAEVMQLTEETLKMAKIANLEYADATDYMTVAIRGFKLEMSDAQNVVDVYSNIAAVTASDTEELAVAMSKTASSAEAVGSSFENTTAMIALMVETTREAPQNIGSAMKSIISRYGEMTSDPTKLVDSEGEEMSLNRVDKALKTVGITLKDANGQFREFDDVILELSKKWNTIDKNTQRYIATIMAGNRQQSRFLALVGNYDRLSELYEEAADSQDAATLQTLKTMDSIETKINQLKTTFQEFYTNTGIEELIKGVLDFTTKVIEKIDSIPKAFGKIPVAALGMIGSLISTGKNGALLLMRGIFGVIDSVLPEVEIEGIKIGEYLKKGVVKGAEGTDQEIINKVKLTKTQANWGIVLGSLGSIISSVSLALGDLDTQAGRTTSGLLQLGGGLTSAFGQLLTHNYIGAAITLFSTITSSISTMIETTEEKVERLKDAMEETSNQTILAKDELKTLEDYRKKLEKLTKERYNSDEAYQEWLDLNNEIVNKYPDLLDHMDNEGNLIAKLGENWDKTKKAKEEYYKAAKTEAVAALNYYGDPNASFSSLGGKNPYPSGSLRDSFTFSQQFFDELLFSGIKNVEELEEVYSSFVQKASSARLTPVEERLYSSADILVDTFLDLEGSQTISNLKNVTGLYNAEGGYTLQEVNEQLNDFYTNIFIPTLQDIQKGTSIELINSNLESKGIKISEEIYNSYELMLAGTNFQFENFSREVQKAVFTYVDELDNNKDSFSIDTQIQQDFITEPLTENYIKWLTTLQEDQKEEISKVLGATNWAEVINTGRMGEVFQYWINSYSDYENQILKAFSNDSSLLSIVSKLSEDKQKELDQIYLNATNYTLSNWLELISNILGKDAVKENEEKFKTEYNEQTGSFYKEQKNKFKKLEEQESNKGPATTAENLSANSLQQLFNLQETTNFSDDLIVSLGRSIAKLEQTKQEAFNNILSGANTDLTTLTGYYHFLQQLSKQNIKIDTNTLEQIRSSINPNWIIETELVLKELSTSYSNLEENYSKVVEGLTLDEAIKFGETYGISISDFREQEGKWYLAGQTLEEIGNSMIASTIENIDYIIREMETDLSNLQEGSSEHNELQAQLEEVKTARDYIPQYIAEEAKSVATETFKSLDFTSRSEVTKGLLNLYGWDTNVSSIVKTLFEGDKESILATLQKINEENNLQWSLQEMIEATETLSTLVSTQIQEILEGKTGDIFEISRDTAKALEGTAGIEIKDYWTKDNIRIYQATITSAEEYNEAIQEQLLAGTLVFETAEENISALSQTLEKQNKSEKIKLNLKNNLVDISENEVAEYIVELGLNINDFIYDELTGTYKFNNNSFSKLKGLSQEQEIAYWEALIENISETDYESYLKATTALGIPSQFQYLIKDAQNELFESIISSVTSAIGSGASYEEANQLIKEYDLDLNSDFIETADGLKITQDAVLQIYNELKATKPLAAQIVLDNLTESIMESEEGLNDIYQVEEKIRKINEEINNAKTSDSRKKILQDELTLAKNIHKELLAAGDAFNFMEQDLPTGMTNPLSAWEGLGQAFEVLEGEDFKAGYIDYTDLYNMISMIDEAGIGLNKVATNFNGNAVEASELMKAAAAAMVSVDGEVFVDLTKLGETFKLNADGMKEGIADGLEIFAQSQIEMLDGQIAFLETIVEQQKIFDELDVEQDGIDFSELLPDPNLNDWNKQQEKVLNSLTPFLKNIVFSVGASWDEIINDPNLFRNLNKTEQTIITQLISALRSNEGNWTESELQEIVNGILAPLGQGITINSSILGEVIRIENPEELSNILFEKLKETALGIEEDNLTQLINTYLASNPVEVSVDSFLTFVEGQDTIDSSLIDSVRQTLSTTIVDAGELQATASQMTISIEDGKIVNSEGEKITADILAEELGVDDTAAQAALQEIQDAMDALGLPSNTIDNLESAITKIEALAKNANSISADSVARIRSLISNINNISTQTKTLTVDLQVSSSGGVSVASVGGSQKSKGNVASISLAQGNAKAKGTLMGELGPELYATGGHYYVAGQNGAEFVDLPDDAIVFNHLQTRRLLENGSINGTGTAVTSEKKAVALATGNASGPAMASASDALNQLKEIRAMWQSLLNKSAKDLGKKAGGGSGGSGGGGNDEENKAFLHDLERWYNLLRQIEKLEQQITYEQAKRANMQSGYKYSDSLQKELILLKKQQAAHQELSDLQREYYDERRKVLEKTSYGELIFTYDEDGLMQYHEEEGKGLDILAELERTDENGKAVRTVEEQVAFLKGVGFDISTLLTNADGSKVESNDYQTMMQIFWDGVDGWMEELDGLYDSYNDSMTSVQESIEAQMKIQQEYIDNQLTVEEKLLQAIIDREQAEIDRLQGEKEALDEATSAYIDGLNNALDREKEMYEKNDTSAETSRLQRQLAILQRSGGSAAEIRSLQDQIDSRLQDAYFQEQQDQIDAIQEASNNQLEKMQEQIDIMTEALEYQKENGLLWTEVYEMMNLWTPDQMLQFIEEFTKSYKENSDLQNQEDTEETQKQIEIYKAGEANKERDEAWADFYKNLNYEEEFKNKHAVGAQAVFNEAYAEGGEDAARKAAEQYYKDNEKSDKPADNNSNTDISTTPEDKPTVESGGSNSGKTNSEKKNTTSYGYSETTKVVQEVLNALGHYGNLKVDGILGPATLNAIKNFQTSVGLTADGIAGPQTLEKLQGAAPQSLKRRVRAVRYKTGGLVDFTGPAWVDGTKSKPEAFLSASDTAMLKSKIFSNSDGSLKALVAALEEITNNTSRYSTETNSEQIIIQNAQVNIQPGTISNDYSARRAGEMALEEMVKIARKTTNRVVSR